ALNVAYRDVRHAIPFLVQLWLFATPSIYLETSVETAAAPTASASAGDAIGAGERETKADDKPARSFWVRQSRLLSLNPLEGLIGFFRAALLGSPLPWSGLIYPAIAAPCLLLLGAFYFRRVEDSFADII
ncbi:MAG TPA: hypothetical protein VHB99_01010, partial [Pirellulales bacterium]|nr:hypothetical protein [Pirellulales bacterium]